MAAQQEFDTTDIPDPTAILQKESAAYEQAQKNPSLIGRMTAAGIGAIQNGAGGSPEFQQSQVIQARMKQILSDVNAGGSPDEDPLTKQIRLSSAISRGLIDVSPKLALSAQGDVARLSQAQQQQKLLGLNIDEAKEKLSEQQFKSNITRNTPQTAFLAMDMGKDENGTPQGYKEVKSYDLTDPTSATQMRADMEAAKANGQTLTPMSSKDLFDSKVQAAAAAAQGRAAAAQIRAQEAWQLAAQKTQSGQMDSNTARQFGRILNAGEQGTNVLENITSMPFQGATLGNIGIGMAPGASLLHSTVDTLRNKLSTSDVIRYNTEAAGLQQNLATLETFGLMTRGQTVAVMDRVLAREGDSGIDRLTKLAEAKQIINNSMHTARNVFGPKLDDDTKGQIDAIVTRLNAAIPFTVKDVNQWQTKNDKQATVQDVIRERMAKEQAEGGPLPGQVKPAHGLNSKDKSGKPIHWVGPGATDYEYD